MKKCNFCNSNILESYRFCPDCGIDLQKNESRSTHDTIPLACKNCLNHPSNGGSGSCHCILGSSTIT